MSMSLFRRLPISSPLVSGAVRAPPTMRMCVRPIVRTYRPMALAATVPRVASRSSFVGAAGLLAGGSLFMGGLLGWNDNRRTVSQLLWLSHRLMETQRAW